MGGVQSFHPLVPGVDRARVILGLTKNFLRDTLEVRVSGIWEIGERDFLVMPALTWTRDEKKDTLGPAQE
jgi:hypothetical protein